MSTALQRLWFPGVREALGSLPSRSQSRIASRPTPNAAMRSDRESSIYGYLWQSGLCVNDIAEVRRRDPLDGHLGQRRREREQRLSGHPIGRAGE